MTIQIDVEGELFVFTSLNDWRSSASTRFRNHEASSENTICIDSKNRVCQIGRHFIRADKEDAYPIRVYGIEIDS